MTSLWLSASPTIPTDEFVPDARFDEVIVGAGITGLTAAVLFARSGRRVAVVEARTVGAVASGNTTGKVSRLQGTQLSRIRSHNYQAIVQAYADGAAEAFDWIADYTEAHGIPVERRDAFTYAATAAGSRAVEREFALAESVGMPVRKVIDAGLPFPTYGAVVLPDQLQLDPMDLLAALAADLRLLGGVIFEHARVVDVRAGGSRSSRNSGSVGPFGGATDDAHAAVETTSGSVYAEHVILATGVPVLDRGLYFAKVSAQRSYAQSWTVAESTLPEGMFLGVESPTRSIRTWRGQLLTGGNGHGVGRVPSTQRRVDELADWTRAFWPGAELTHSWSAQDYSPAHHVPFVGWLPRGRGRIYLATGFDKWGMTNGVAAALTLFEDILGENTPWQKVMHSRVTMPATIARGIGENAAVGAWYARGYYRALRSRLPESPPSEGAGLVGRVGLVPTVESTVDGVTCRLTGVCPHLGAVVTWNDSERSWDCPAHGSRFASDGTLLEGPAKHSLRSV